MLEVVSDAEVYGRMVHAARILSGLDQAAFGRVAGGLAGATISNAERGSSISPETKTAIEKAIRKRGIVCKHDGTNEMVMLSFRYEDVD
jgi:hypothetical protein